MRVRNRLEAVRKADRLLEALRSADELAATAARSGSVSDIPVLLQTVESSDQVMAIAAIHALACIPDPEVDEALMGMLTHEQGFVREHSVWALGSRAPRIEAVGPLIYMVVTGGFTGMLSQRTLEEWAKAAPATVAARLESALAEVVDPAQRFRLVETLGLVPGSAVAVQLARIAGDVGEGLLARVAAVSALGDQVPAPTECALLEQLTQLDGVLAEVAKLALADINAAVIASNASDGGGAVDPAGTKIGGGLTIAQLFLHADIDPELSNAGNGDNGGIATLLVRLGDALVGTSDRLGDEVSLGGVERVPVTRVLTLSRGDIHEAAQNLEVLRKGLAGHVYARIPLLQDPVQAANAWPLRVTARRGIARMIRAAGRVDVIHLRMADVGSLAALEVARASNIPVVFTSAPDPHVLINTMDLSGRLTRENFGSVDETEHFWFRVNLLQRLVASSAHTVYFPRPNLQFDMRDLMGIDVAKAPGKHTTVPEGIDLSLTDEAVNEARRFAEGGTPSSALSELRELLQGLPPERRGLPLLLSVGRFHRVKGTASIVEAWAGSELRERANLLLIGGNLLRPSIDEQDQLDRIHQIIEPEQRMAGGLVLSGHRPNGVVSRWIAAARFGLPGFVAPNGVYVCGSLKEEFGLAVLEAMAAGLLVVAPDGGGPATYVEHGHTGFLTSTWVSSKLRDAIGEALDRAADERTDERAQRSRSVVEQGYTVEAMAKALVGVYSGTHHDSMTLQQELDVFS